MTESTVPQHDPATCEGCQAVRNIPAHRVNAFTRRITAADAGHNDNHDGPNLGPEFDTTGGAHLYRDERFWRWDGITDRHKKGTR